MPFFQFNLHHENVVLHRIFLLCFLFLLGGSVAGQWACGGKDTDRLSYHMLRSQGVFGNSQRIKVVAEPGLVKACEDADDKEETRVCVRAGAPFPAMRVSNGDIFVQDVSIHLTNVPKNATWNVYLEPLMDDDPQDQRCKRDALGPPEDTSARLADDEGRDLTMRLPACSSLVFVETSADTQKDASYRIAVLGGIHMRKSELQLFLDRLAQIEPAIDFVYFAGDISIGNRTDSLDLLDDMMQEIDRPWSVLLSPYFVLRGYQNLVDRVGSLDYVTRVFSMPIFVFDSADARLTADQQAFLTRIRVCEPTACPDAIALMAIPPVSAHLFDVGIFRSQMLAMKVLQDLRERGVGNVISSADKRLVLRSYSGVHFYDVGQLQSHDVILELVFTPPSTYARRCDGWTSIVEHSRWTVAEPYIDCDAQQTCVRGVCLTKCTSDADCVQDRERCDDEHLCRLRCDDPQCQIPNACEDQAYCPTHGTLEVFSLPM